MQYFLLGLTSFVLLLMALRWFMTASAQGVARNMRAIAGFGLCGLGLLFAARGALPVAIPLFGLGFMLLSGIQSNRGGFRDVGGSGASGRHSGVTTDYLEMALDHDSGMMAGRVRKGRFEGRLLAELSVNELIDLWADCARNDHQSTQLMEAYLDRMAPQWREMTGTAGAEHERDERGQTGQGAKGRAERRSGPMSRAEALQILGLAEGASQSEIRQAHRRLMKQYHPDQGGSDYLASKINEAKDLLLGNR